MSCSTATAKSSPSQLQVRPDKSGPAPSSQDWMSCLFIRLVYLQTTGAELFCLMWHLAGGCLWLLHYYISWGLFIYVSCKRLSQNFPNTSGKHEREIQKIKVCAAMTSCAMQQLELVARGTPSIRTTPTTDCCFKPFRWSHDEFQQIYQVRGGNTLMARCQAKIWSLLEQVLIPN